MFDVLRERMSAYLRQQGICIIATTDGERTSAFPVRYRTVCAAEAKHALEVDCLLPRWSEAVYHVERDPHVLLTILDTQAEALRWLEYRGSAHILDAPEWGGLLPEAVPIPRPCQRYRVIRVTPSRLDLLDESRGWSSRETLDL